MKILKSIFISLTIALSLFALHAQTGPETTTILKLRAPKMWHSKSSDSTGTYSFLKIDSVNFKNGMYGEGREVFNTHSYYLSDEIPSVFDSTKVGKIKNGKYIVLNHNNKVETFEILLLTVSNLILKYPGTGVESVLDAEY